MRLRRFLPVLIPILALSLVSCSVMRDRTREFRSRTETRDLSAGEASLWERISLLETDVRDLSAGLQRRTARTDEVQTTTVTEIFDTAGRIQSRTTETRGARSRTDIDEASSTTLTDRSETAVSQDREEDRIRVDVSSVGSEESQTESRSGKPDRDPGKKVKTALILFGTLLAGVLVLVWICRSNCIRKTIKHFLKLI